LLDKIEKSKEEKKEADDDSEGEDEGIDKGPSVCSIDQSAITGESLAVEKYLGDIAYYTCGVKRGKVRSLVLS
jgi:H+-transporting ATPase